ncbi:fork head domain-domain-containing protein [Absidia repens]|uniref:Fork head domain-domain-containing protein n=1 Tax=Absidia repens TaxID=90262 RepID=A0A1X2IDP2_9FUNG|nr:fork head domain-domain-containing protein [Absidia repens]
MPSDELGNNSCNGSSSNHDSNNNNGDKRYIEKQLGERRGNTSTRSLPINNNNGTNIIKEYQYDDYIKFRRETQLPSIPVVMRHPHVVSSPTRKRRRPPFSYSSLITQAILEAENERMTLRQIYDWIVQKYPSLYNATDIGWQNTIRHNLSLNRCFKKLPKSDSDISAKGKGGYWTIDPNHMAKFKNGAFARGSSSSLRRKPSNFITTKTENIANVTEQHQPTQQQQSTDYPSTPLPSLHYIHEHLSTSDSNAIAATHPPLNTLPRPTTNPSPSFMPTQSTQLFKKPNCDSTALRPPDPASSSCSSASASLTVMNIHNILN